MVVSAAERFARAPRVVFRGYVLWICGTGPSEGRQGVVVEAPLPVLMNVRKEQGGEGEGREGRGGEGRGGGHLDTHGHLIGRRLRLSLSGGHRIEAAHLHRDPT
jgi:hypothetical protein